MGTTGVSKSSAEGYGGVRRGNAWTNAASHPWKCLHCYRVDAVLPRVFDLVVLGKKEKEAIKARGKNLERKEADVDANERRDLLKRTSCRRDRSRKLNLRLSQLPDSSASGSNTTSSERVELDKQPRDLVRNEPQGAGSYMRMKILMVTHVTVHRESMFRNATNVVQKQLDDPLTRIQNLL
ncbi:hypothetical protein C8A03DRAFT_39013, partial [Achaetomium macrosporum]